ncbi:helix-turn-helix domain-containing protein [Chryseobacterium indoltheticum]|uniref:Anaerobic benzoate catabolism transcriptional regulator n=1 Tax=Chryseobacterium indoltheticum TaxID=254 RepID=A0A381FIV4_9FLAO|nr:helix-turn-helix domain-containing protein [Chryseobacterium indoltheticum]AZA61123.1 helix-turn-helix domain-containing protein [Chryseobacterium indoltheticum]SUX46454.1 anaerobic benzoate catabolism transcriptional regulator [Chryseobacterium indoltheticum]
MSELKKIREKRNLTQEELAEKSGISVRTIQRIEAGTTPKGYTLKTLAESLEVSENDLLISETIKEEIVIDEVIDTTEENHSLFNSGLIKIINLSSLPFAWLPIANFLLPLLIMFFTKEKSPIVKQIISLQIFLAIISPIIFMLIALLKLGSVSVMITMIVLVLTNVYIILRNAYEIDKKQSLRYKLNFSFI